MLTIASLEYKSHEDATEHTHMMITSVQYRVKQPLTITVLKYNHHQALTEQALMMNIELHIRQSSQFANQTNTSREQSYDK